MTTKQHYYGVAASHPVLKMQQGIGPFPTATEAGAALDQLQALYPSASLRIYEPSAKAIGATPGESINERIDHARHSLASTLGQVEPYSVIEILEMHDERITTDYAHTLAEKIGCPPDEIGLIQGSPRWIVVRRHLDTSDYAKAETKALWLRRSRDQEAGGDKQGEICVVTLPIYAPAENGTTEQQ
ncbi:hypothetical protein BVH03_17445 [Pseudomonas sp. PA15(2017)]|uniref:hypothetical protein n=1 Tax=Pseudomonas sp. PA15(2017) TaxID=1932111 RepID=UPI00095CCA0D|nr:hypothetical protein [Pseudomonas sp. PA15(2017)]OLU25443.1 hypothetical protein BVH03_17445 [Pseudomonas sp. PA15(2017)]